MSERKRITNQYKLAKNTFLYNNNKKTINTYFKYIPPACWSVRFWTKYCMTFQVKFCVERSYCKSKSITYIAFFAGFFVFLFYLTIENCNKKRLLRIFNYIRESWFKSLLSAVFIFSKSNIKTYFTT